MISYDFETITHGKWILAGEHAVLRGHPALAFPITEKQLTLRYRHQKTGLSVDVEGDESTDMQQLFLSVLKHGMKILELPMDNIHGQFQIQNNIPVGAGMGASAALCVALSRWFASQHVITSLNIQPFATELEHLFHGQSSGLDIAGVAATSGIYFKQGIITPIKQSWQPNWFLSSCGEIGMTSPCIKAVQTLWESDPAQAQAIDQQMKACVEDGLTALEKGGAQQLTKAINSAAECFLQWGLITASLQQHMQMLRDAGAIAVKPTGSGGGGFVISLWQDTPNETCLDLIRLKS